MHTNLDVCSFAPCPVSQSQSMSHEERINSRSPRDTCLASGVPYVLQTSDRIRLLMQAICFTWPHWGQVQTDKYHQRGTSKSYLFIWRRKSCSRQWHLQGLSCLGWWGKTVVLTGRWESWWEVKFVSHCWKLLQLTFGGLARLSCCPKRGENNMDMSPEHGNYAIIMQTFCFYLKIFKIEQSLNFFKEV